MPEFPSPPYAGSGTYVQFWCSDLTTAITAGTVKGYWYPPVDVTVDDVRVNLVSACSTGTFTVDLNDGGTSILSTKITVDATEDTSATATTPPVISDTSILSGAEVTADVDDAADGTATGLLVTIFYTEV